MEKEFQRLQEDRDSAELDIPKDIPNVDLTSPMLYEMSKGTPQMFTVEPEMRHPGVDGVGVPVLE